MFVKTDVTWSRQAAVFCTADSSQFIWTLAVPVSMASQQSCQQCMNACKSDPEATFVNDRWTKQSTGDPATTRASD